jgi:hypothetical protein
MRGIGARALGSSQVSQWHGAGNIVVPSRPMTQTFPSFIAADYTYVNGPSENTTPTPSAVLTNDLIIAVAYASPGATQREVYAPTASGLTFTDIWVHPTNGGSNGLKRVAWALSPDTTPRAVTFTCSGGYTWAVQYIIFRGVNTSSPIESDKAWTTTTSTTSPTFTGITTQNFAKVLAVVQGSDTLGVASSGWTSHQSAYIGNPGYSMIASLDVGNPGAVTGPTFSLGSATYSYGLVFGVRAAPAA